MRLDKFLVHHLGASRKIITKELKASKITVDGGIVKEGARHISLEQTICYDGNVIEPIVGHRYFLLNKPDGYICSQDDSLYPTITQLLDEPMLEKLHAAGRLDVDSTGLVLITDDGQWSHRITSPKSDLNKVYRITTAEPLLESYIDAFAQGILLNGEKEKTNPATLLIIDDFIAEITISEGKYHQVKRMIAALGNRVVTLHRTQIGKIVLDVNEGEYRHLSNDEISSHQK